MTAEMTAREAGSNPASGNSNSSSFCAGDWIRKQAMGVMF